MLWHPIESFDQQGFAISFNPPGDQHFQFRVICKVILQFGFERSGILPDNRLTDKPRYMGTLINRSNNYMFS